jgi:DNA-binding YbaB/EbfC family protein
MDMDALMGGIAPIQQKMKQAEAERAATVLEGKAGGGAVSVKLTGALEVKAVTIAPAAAQAAGGDVGMLEDLVLAAMNDALRQYRTRYGASPDEQIQKMLGGTDMMALMGPLMRGLGR